MHSRATSPILIGRQEELSRAEDALIAARRGDGRLLVVAGEAGMGKTRLSSELTERAAKFGSTVLWGGCAEAEFSLPYLPFVEAIGNYLRAHDPAEIAELLGPMRGELSRLFPQLGDGGRADDLGEPGQSKLRLFESILAVLEICARGGGLVLVIDDLHWSDASTRELLDYVARRLSGLDALLVATYRTDEMDRKHPLLPTIQSWRRSGLGTFIDLLPLGSNAVAEMISTIFDHEKVSDEFRDLMHSRSEGNPFVLEEMLKEAIERGDIFKTETGWDRRAMDDLRIPITVRDTIILRLQRLDETVAAILQAASVLGRDFSYAVLRAIIDAEETQVHSALQVGVSQQLLDEVKGSTMTFRWRHALTREAIYEDLVMPRRQQLHSRAADAISVQLENDRVDLAQHLFSAGRFSEAVPVSMAEADAAAATFAFSEAVDLWERALPHIADPLLKARILCRIGEALAMNGEADRAARTLLIAIDQLESVGGKTEAAHYRLLRGRALWEASDSVGAMREYEQALEVLEPEPPSPDLALAYLRIASHHAFQLDYALCGEWAQRAVDVAEATGATNERLLSRGFLALSLVAEGRVQDGIEILRECIAECIESGNPVVGVTLIFNEAWTGSHLMLSTRNTFEKLDRLPRIPALAVGRAMLESDERLAAGELHRAAELAELGRDLSTASGLAKMVWRSTILLAEALFEQGRYADSQAVLPKITTRSEIQDLVYDGVVRMRLGLANGDIEGTLDVARSLAVLGDKVSVYRRDLAAAVETLTACNELDEAEALMLVCRDNPSQAGVSRLDAASAQIRLARGDPQGALAYCESALGGLSGGGYVLEELRARITLAEVQVKLLEKSRAEETLTSLLDEAGRLGAGAVIDEAIQMAERVGLFVVRPIVADPSGEANDGAIPLGERMITSMFADIRSYTPMTAATPPHDLADKMANLFRWARDEVEKHGGVVDKFAGDAVMATFNVSGTSVDHPVQALNAALALQEKVRLASIPMGIGIAVGPAIVGNAVEGGHLMVAGVATNLAARLQSAAKAGEIILSEEAYRRLKGELVEMRLEVNREHLELKGFDETQTVFRLSFDPVG